MANKYIQRFKDGTLDNLGPFGGRHVHVHQDCISPEELARVMQPR